MVGDAVTVFNVTTKNFSYINIYKVAFLHLYTPSSLTDIDLN